MAAKFEFCVTTMEKSSPWTEVTQFVSYRARDEHHARRVIVQRCLNDGQWVIFIILVADLT
jgi:hypothetical protein